MPLTKREKKLLAEAIEHLTDEAKMADHVRQALLKDASLYIRSWALPALKAIRDNDKRMIAQLARYL